MVSGYLMSLLHRWEDVKRCGLTSKHNILGQIPHIVEISHWPGQSDHPYEEKVPTVVLYDDRRRVSEAEFLSSTVA